MPLYQSILLGLVKILGIVFGWLAFILLMFFLFGTFKALFSEKLLYSGMTFKRLIYRVWYRIRKHKYIKPVDFVKWVIIDFLRGKDKLRLFGIWCFTGYFGEGKTLGAVTFAKHLQKQYPHRNIKIFTNFEMRGQTGKITSWEDLLSLPKNSIVIFDEIQSTFTSQKFKDFPIDLLWKITQCRKTGLCIFASSPVFHRMTIQLRENTDYVVVCKNRFRLDRWFSYRFYNAPDYEKYQESLLGLTRYLQFSYSFVASDYDYRNYDTTQIVDRMDIEGNTTNQEAKLRDKLIKEMGGLVTS